MREKNTSIPEKDIGTIGGFSTRTAIDFIYAYTQLKHENYMNYGSFTFSY